MEWKIVSCEYVCLASRPSSVPALMAWIFASGYGKGVANDEKGVGKQGLIAVSLGDKKIVMM